VALGFTEHNKMFKALDQAYRAIHALHFEVWESADRRAQKRTEDLPPPNDRDF
jgi:hypothetical protein